MLMLGFTTGLAPGVLKDGQYILNYAQFPDPDSVGNYTSFTCTVPYSDAGFSAGATDIKVQNYYGAASFMIGKATAGGPGATQINAADAMTSGPWTLAGDPTATTVTDLTWAQAYALESEPTTSSTCGAGRMVGAIPDTVFAG